MTEPPAVDPEDVAAVAAALRAAGAPAERAMTIAQHVRLVLWPAMDKGRAPSAQEGRDDDG